MKDKIKQLFQGTKEDMIIACNLLVNNYDPKEFIAEWEKEIGPEFLRKAYSNRTDFNRSLVIFKEEPEKLFDNNSNVYYKISDTFYILLDVGQAIAECWDNYDRTRKVINHF